jgi:DNA polymerase V
MDVFGIALGLPTPLSLLARPVAAGFPSPADDFIEEEIDLQRLLIVNRPATYLVRVAGDSMIAKGLFDGDLAVVDRSLEPQNGDVVMVDVDGERSFKVWQRQARRVTLSFANPRYPTFALSAGAVIEVWGVVSASINPRRRAQRG